MTRAPFRILRSRAVVLPEENIDTDQIIPARFLTTTGRDGLGDYAFYDWRHDAAGNLTDHFLNHLDRANHKILVAGDNFGCGSSREHAAWALLAFGFRAVVSTSFGDIFQSNALKNGLLPVTVDDVMHAKLLDRAGHGLTIDLEQETLVSGNTSTGFATEPFARRCLLDGTDFLGVLLDALPQIEAYEASISMNHGTS